MTRDQATNHQRALDARQPDLTVLMDAVTKPHNVSAIIRTADAVGIQQVHTTSTGELARRNYMSLGGAKHWAAVTTHRSTRAALTALRADGWRLEPRTVAKDHAIIAMSITRRRWRSLSGANSLA